MKFILLVGIGGFIGSVLRYSISLFFQVGSTSTFPFGTLTINIIGCLVIGAVYAKSESSALSKETFLFLATGLCGGFTTFSAFSIENINMIKDGQLMNSIVYILASVIIGILATFSGFAIFRNF